MSKKKKPASAGRRHGNSLDNDAPHHLYEIKDIQENEVFKYGISQDPIEADGLSKRLRDQINLYNIVVGFVRFFARILIRDIPNRVEALDLEEKHIDAYEKKFGKKPRGNRR